MNNSFFNLIGSDVILKIVSYNKNVNLLKTNSYFMIVVNIIKINNLIYKI